MPVTISGLNVEDGQEILLPFEVSGVATASAGNVNIIGWQIDDQDVHDVDLGNPLSQTFAFDFNISAIDCMQVNAWYMLTIYAWDSAGAVSPTSRTFKRIEPSSGPPQCWEQDCPAVRLLDLRRLDRHRPLVSDRHDLFGLPTGDFLNGSTEKSATYNRWQRGWE